MTAFPETVPIEPLPIEVRQLIHRYPRTDGSSGGWLDELFIRVARSGDLVSDGTSA
jgi:hypothetical protein